MTINYNGRLRKEGGDVAAFLRAQVEVSRDNARTLMAPSSCFGRIRR